jgi:hypothetical protein
VYQHKGIDNATRVLLLYLADHMHASGTVSVPLATISTDLKVPRNRIGERIRQARDAKLLTIVVYPCPGRTAVYKATIAPSSTDGRPHRKRPGGLVQPTDSDGGEPFPTSGTEPFRTSGTERFRTSYQGSGSPRPEPSHAQTVPDVGVATTTATSETNVTTDTTDVPRLMKHALDSKSNPSSLRSPRSGEPAKPETQEQADDRDDELTHARMLLSSLNPIETDRYRARAAAQALGAAVGSREITIRAAAEAQADGKAARSDAAAARPLDATGSRVEVA